MEKHEGSQDCDNRMEVQMNENSRLGPKWIKCCDSLPVENERVLISCNEGICSGRFSYNNWQCDPIGSYAGDGCVYYVTHWMPLPTIPEK